MYHLYCILHIFNDISAKFRKIRIILLPKTLKAFFPDYSRQHCVLINSTSWVSKTLWFISGAVMWWCQWSCRCKILTTRFWNNCPQLYVYISVRISSYIRKRHLYLKGSWDSNVKKNMQSASVFFLWFFIIWVRRLTWVHFPYTTTLEG